MIQVGELNSVIAYISLSYQTNLDGNNINIDEYGRIFPSRH
jgi:hypothetical protein